MLWRPVNFTVISTTRRIDKSTKTLLKVIFSSPVIWVLSLYGVTQEKGSILITPILILMHDSTGSDAKENHTHRTYPFIVAYLPNSQLNFNTYSGTTQVESVGRRTAVTHAILSSWVDDRSCAPFQRSLGKNCGDKNWIDFWILSLFHVLVPLFLVENSDKLRE